MKPAMKKDLADCGDILESFVDKLSVLPEKDLIDLAARLKPVAKHINEVLDYVKDVVKTELSEEEGTLTGGEFKAVLKRVDTFRLNQKALREHEPEIHAKYNEACTDLRVSFELR